MKENKIQIEYLGSINCYDINLLIAKNLKKIFLQDRTRGLTLMQDLLIERSDLSSIEYNISKAIVETFYEENSEKVIRDITQRILDLEIGPIDLLTYAKKFKFTDNSDIVIHVKDGKLVDATASVRCLTYFNYTDLNFLSSNKKKKGGKK